MGISCEQIRNEFSALLDDELDQEDREFVEEHLSDCADCLRELHGYKVVSDTYFYHHPVKAPEDFEERLRVALAPAPTGWRSHTTVWRFAAAAVILMVVGLSAWRMASSSSAPMMLSKLEEPERALGADEIRDSAQTSVPVEERAAGASAEMAVSDAPESPLAGDGLGAMEEGIGGRTVRDNTFYESKTLESKVVAESEADFPVAQAAPMAKTDDDLFVAKDASEVAEKSSNSIEESAIAEGEAVAPRQEFGAPMAPPAEVPADATASQDKKESTSQALPMAAPAPPVSPDESTVAKVRPDMARRERSSAVDQEPGGFGVARIAAPIQWNDRKFELRGDTLTQSDFRDETLVDIAIPSDAWNTLLDNHPDLIQLMKKAKKAIVSLDERWYRISTST
tara:strand:+ start:137 stop:1324 length:1188 start_codon:yes stop_codon:yes gene_type:complete